MAVEVIIVVVDIVVAEEAIVLPDAAVSEEAMYRGGIMSSIHPLAIIHSSQCSAVAHFQMPRNVARIGLHLPGLLKK